MKKTVFVILAVVLAAVVAVAGCISTETETQSPVGQWITNGEYTVSFNPDGTMMVVAGNTYTGTYKVTESGIEISDVTQLTKMMASEEETAFINSLKSATGFKTENGDLTLTGEETITFKHLVFGEWKTEDGITVTLKTDMTFAATAGVNIIMGTYQYTENGLVFDMETAASTMAMGTEEEMAAEQAMIDALAAVTSYISNGNQITFTDADGKELMTLTHSPVDTWISGDITMNLAADGTVSLNAGNTYTGTYTISEHMIVVKDLTAVTKMMVSEDEKAFLAALEAAGNTLNVNQFLTGYDKDGKVVLTFTFA